MTKTFCDSCGEAKSRTEMTSEQAILLYRMLEAMLNQFEIENTIKKLDDRPQPAHPTKEV